VGKIIDSVIIGILCYIGMAVFNISDRYTLLVSIFVGVTNVIPFFGPYIGAIPSALLILLENPLHGVYFLIFILVLQQFDGNILGPKILGDSTGLSAFWVVFAILGFGGMFGFIGMILGVPTFAVIYYLIKSFVNEKLLKQGLPTETEEFMRLTGVSEDGKLCQNGTDNDMNNEGTQTKIWGSGFLRKIGKRNRKE
jgi:predicted PurR-regulated permease PerM